MATVLHIFVGILFIQYVTCFTGFGTLSCGWRYGGQCKASCDRGDYIMGPLPCGFGIQGTCCAPTLPCWSHGGTCRDGGCLENSETVYSYKVSCPRVSQTCCLGRAFDRQAINTPDPTPVTSQPGPFPERCSSRPPYVPTSRIFGGQAVQSSCQWPWMVSIVKGSPSFPGSHICAGVLISNNKVLTTVGCTTGEVFVRLQESNIFHSDAGEIDIPTTGSPLIHENFNPPANQKALFANDIAILTLATPLPRTTCAKPVCLPRSQERPARTSNCYVAGWGINALNDGLLHEATVNVLDNDVCALSLAIGRNKRLPADKLCSAPTFDGTTACGGDHGGMLICEDEAGIWSLFGLISDNSCRSSLPVIYTDVQTHLDWITRNL